MSVRLVTLLLFACGASAGGPDDATLGRGCEPKTRSSRDAKAKSRSAVACLLALLRQPEAFSTLNGQHALAQSALRLSSVGLMGRPRTLILSVAASHERRAAMRLELRKAGLASDEWLHVLAIYGDDLNMDALWRLGVLVEPKHPRDVATGLSHMQIWAALGRSNSSAPVLILEDDVRIHTPALMREVERLSGLMTQHDGDILNLNWYRHMTDAKCIHEQLRSPRCPAGCVSPELLQLSCSTGLNTGMTAYLITPRGARRALHATLPIRENVDIQLGGSSGWLRWLAVRNERALVEHNWRTRSVRVQGLPSNATV